MVDIDYFRAIQNSTGANYTQDVIKAEARQDFEDGFYSSIGLERDISIGCREQDFIITNTKKDDICDIFSILDEPFYVGELVYFNDSKWMVTEKSTNNDIFHKGKIQKCNLLLKWQDIESFSIIKRWCISADAQAYSFGENSKNAVSLGKGRRKIILPKDEDTVKLRRNKRFLIDWSNGEYIPYKLTGFDSITLSEEGNCDGLLIIYVDEDVLQVESDNEDLGIANYINHQGKDVNNTVIAYSGNAEVRVGGKPKMFTATFVNGSGEELEVAPTWNIVADEYLLSKIGVIKQANSSITLECKDEDCIGNSFILRASAESEGSRLEAELKVDLVSLF